MDNENKTFYSSEPFGWHMTTVKISPEMMRLCKENYIKISEATRVGISMLLAEKGIKEYDNRLNIYRKMVKYQEELQKALERLYELEEEKNIKVTNVQPKGFDEAEVNKILSASIDERQSK